MHVRYGQFWVLMAVVLLAACDLQPRSSTGVDNPVAQIVVYPDTLTLDPQQSFQFRVFGRTQAGDSMPVSVRWETSAGSVSAFGVYTAGTSAGGAVLTAPLRTLTTSGNARGNKRRPFRVVTNPKSNAIP